MSSKLKKSENIKPYYYSVAPQNNVRPVKSIISIILTCVAMLITLYVFIMLPERQNAFEVDWIWLMFGSLLSIAAFILVIIDVTCNECKLAFGGLFFNLLFGGLTIFFSVAYIGLWSV